jgi:hypothetical protein
MAYYPPQQSQHPPLPPPWRSEWDQRDQRYVFINPQTGERTFQFPQQTYPPQGNYGGYPPQQGGYGGGGYNQQQGNYGGGYGQPQGGPQQGAPRAQPPPPQAKDHKAMQYGAIGAVAGLAVGGLAMYEGEKIRKLSLVVAA